MTSRVNAADRWRIAVARGQTRDIIAFDFQATTRRVDEDGHMHVADNKISKASVCPYYGHEIPGWNDLHLDPNHVYRLLRHPDELAKSAGSFVGKPILLVHKPSMAKDHPRALSVGSVSAPVEFDGLHLRAPLHFWDQEAIDGIEDKSQRALSSGYRYDPDMTPGTWEGQPYDGVMRNIRGNHVALVKKGRAGPEVVVGDAALAALPTMICRRLSPMKTAAVVKVSPTALVAEGAVRAFLATNLASDQQIDIAAMIKGVTGKTWAKDKPRIIKALTAAMKDKLAEDADMDDLPPMLAAADPAAAAEAKAPPVGITPPNAGLPPINPDPDDDEDGRGGSADGDDEGIAAKVHAMLADKLPPEDLAAVMAVLSHEVSEAAPGQDEPPSNGVTPIDNNKRPPVQPITKQAMDKAIAKAVSETESKTVQRLNAIAAARKAVFPIVGDMAIEPKDATEVYEMALDEMKVDLTGVPREGFAAMFNTAAKLRAEAQARQADPRRPARERSMALDEAQMTSFRERYGEVPRQV